MTMKLYDYFISYIRKIKVSSKVYHVRYYHAVGL